ncbi:hypothetical protein MNBD_GAMMA25-829 [hydrothermal vent metagenome]|uniref:Uncharacterized protein n=1 Tax=hydrothermal vent metagenome TaxID=652676 RepID=A0A3B1B377_9ZZZZ
MQKVLKLLLLIILISIGYSHASWAIDGFEDDEGCLLCHKYPKMGRITENGTQRHYYIIPHIFSKTVHRNVPCTDCHNYIKQLPHREVKEGVKCDTECHSVKNPATGKNFSHKPIYDKYIKSTHGRKKVAEGHDQDKPYCVTCHTNPVYNPDEDKAPKRIVDRCVVCHEDSKFVTNWYRHTSRRIREVKRSSEEIVELCSNCHGDKRLVERHMADAKKDGRELGRKYPYAVESYNESFHGKVTRYGYKKAANCLDCHADYENYYMSVHFIRPSRDPVSPVSPERKLKTCQRCHTYADENYAALDPHPTSYKDDNPFRHYAEIVYGWVGDIVLALLVGMAMFETVGRRRDGVIWKIKKGSSWWRRSKRGRDRKL